MAVHAYFCGAVSAVFTLKQGGGLLGSLSLEGLSLFCKAAQSVSLLLFESANGPVAKLYSPLWVSVFSLISDL